MNFHFERVLNVLQWSIIEFLSFCVTFWAISLSEQSLYMYKKKYHFNIYNYLQRDEFSFPQQNSATNVTLGLQPPCCYPSRRTPTWRPITSPNISHIKNCTELNCGKIFAYLLKTLHLPDSGLYLLNDVQSKIFGV